ncbi:hypothetical protein MUK42_19471 [Musa troglodytarum]|uniref:Uncharacterized protein n=1 Tax=Musa troglodytarum TaxID=320322 RepID=A0A9E7FS37_9LILI|nr:hypothetical protein MUK42_19471 [Musa troglodytarum]
MGLATDVLLVFILMRRLQNPRKVEKHWCVLL